MSSSLSANEFLKACEDLKAEVAEIEVQYRIAVQNSQQRHSEAMAEVEAFSKLPVPSINGEPVINFSFDMSKLNNPAYVKEVLELIPSVLLKLEQTGLALKETAIVKEG